MIIRIYSKLFQWFITTVINFITYSPLFYNFKGYRYTTTLNRIGPLG